MTDYVLPTCYVAGTVLLVGEQYRELVNLRNKLLPDFFYRLFDEPAQAKCFLSNSYSSHVLEQGWLETCATQQGNLPDQKTLSAELQSSHRFEEVSVLVLDNTMKCTDAIAFCRDVSSLRCKKIMLINQEDLAQTKLALANGIIDGYIIKNSSKCIKIKLTTAIFTLAYNCFQQASLPLVKQLQAKLPYLTDVAFVDFFQTLCFDKQILEFYLLDTLDGYVLLNAQAQPVCLYITTDEPPKHCLNNTVKTVYGRQTYYCYLSETLPPTLQHKQLDWTGFATFCARVAEYL